MTTLATNSSATMSTLEPVTSTSLSFSNILDNTFEQSSTSPQSSLSSYSSTNCSSQDRKFSLVKWIDEHSDHVTTVPNTSIIDCPSDSLRPGMIVRVMKNSGQVVRAQIVMPNSVDTSSSHKFNVPDLISSSLSVKEELKQESVGNQYQQSGGDHLIPDNSSSFEQSSQNIAQLMMLTTSSGVLSPSFNQYLSSQNGQSSSTSLPAPHATYNYQNSCNTSYNYSYNTTSGSKVSKELQFLQSAINEADLTDSYHSLNATTSQHTNLMAPQGSAMANSSSYSPAVAHHSYSYNNRYPSYHETHQTMLPPPTMQHHPSDSTSIDYLFQMQHELASQQRELKIMEQHTSESLKLLHLNLTKLAKKFDSFETNVLGRIRIQSSIDQVKKSNPVKRPYCLSDSETTKTDNSKRVKKKTSEDTTSDDMTIEMINSKIQTIHSQIALNKFIREEVKKRVGIEFLANHSVSEIPAELMNQIKKDALNMYTSDDRRPTKAWGLAMASLRCLKRDLASKNKAVAAHQLDNPSIKSNQDLTSSESSQEGSTAE